MKYLQILKENQENKENGKSEKILTEKANKAALMSKKHIIDLQIDLDDKKKALETALLQDSLNFRSIAEIKKEIKAKEAEIRDHEEFHKEYSS